MLAVNSRHHERVPDRQEHVLVLRLGEKPSLKKLKLFAIVQPATEVDLLADFIDGVVEELRHIEAQLAAHRELIAHLLAGVEQAPDPLRIHLPLQTLIEGDPGAILLILVASRREVHVRIDPPLFWGQRVDVLLYLLGLLDLDLDALVE